MVKGIVRNLDKLGRATLPSEMRRTLGIAIGEPVDMWIDGGVIRLKAYDKNLVKGVVRHIDTLGRATIPKEYRKSLHFTERNAVDMYFDGPVICLESVRASCVFCGSQSREELVERNGKYICQDCLKAMA